MSDAPPYVIAHVREALVRDPRVAELHVDVAVNGRAIFVTGEVPTEERRQAISELLRDQFAGYEHHNHTTVETVAAPQRREEIE
jgi:hypothetical protein